MESILVVHLIFVGLWLGCVVTEALFERALLGKGVEAETMLSILHVKVDMFVEIPAFTVVGLTGLYLASTRELSAMLMFKLASALIAIVANIYCVKLVFSRRSYALSGDWVAFNKVDHLQHKVGAIVLIGILVAIILGAFA